MLDRAGRVPGPRREAPQSVFSLVTDVFYFCATTASLDVLDSYRPLAADAPDLNVNRGPDVLQVDPDRLTRVRCLGLQSLHKLLQKLGQLRVLICASLFQLFLDDKLLTLRVRLFLKRLQLDRGVAVCDVLPDAGIGVLDRLRRSVFRGHDRSRRQRAHKRSYERVPPESPTPSLTP